jgi:hypothetical protein
MKIQQEKLPWKILNYFVSWIKAITWLMVKKPTTIGDRNPANTQKLPTIPWMIPKRQIIQIY